MPQIPPNNVSLYEAAKVGDAARVRELLAAGSDLSVKGGEYDETPLHCAAGAGHLAVVELLINKGADVDAGDKFQRTPLYRAAGEGHMAVVELLIIKGADVDAGGDYQRTPLYRAAAAGHLAVVEKLLSAGADPSCLQEFVDDDQHSYMFFSGSIYQVLVDSLITAEYNRTQSAVFVSRIKSIYSIVQMKCMCSDGVEKQVFDLLSEENRLQQLKAALDELDDESDEISVVKQRFVDDFLIYKEIKENKPEEKCQLCVFQENLKKKLINVSKTLIKAVKSCSKCCKGSGQDASNGDQSESVNFFHLCKTRGFFTPILLFLAMFAHVLDIESDMEVGINDYRSVSAGLGGFEIILVIFTLIHENVNSALSLFAAEEEFLRMKKGKKNLTYKDWDSSMLNRSKNSGKQVAFMLMFPFRCKFERIWTWNGITAFLKAMLFNLLSLFLLRPVVDILLILLHGPNSVRVYHRHQSRKYHLRQYYLILEQLPEMLMQIYTFQIILLKTIVPVTANKSACFSGSAYGSANNITESDTSWMCNVFSINAGIDCSMFVRKVSIAVPLLMVPKSLISLETAYRTLNPVSIKLGFLVHGGLHLSIMFMITSRVVLFSAMGRVSVSQNKFYLLIGYVLSRVVLDLIINSQIHGYFSNLKESSDSFLSLVKGLYRNDSDSDSESRKRKKGELITRLGNIWYLCLLSFRDLFLVSLREPHAYRQVPTEVSSDSVRETRVLACRGFVLLAEGVVAAILIDQYYPCSEVTHVFQYIGWICVCSIILSVELLVIVSIFTKLKIKVESKQRILVRNLVIFSVGTATLFTISFIFHISGERSDFEIHAVVILLGAHTAVAVLVLALFYMFGGPPKGGSSNCCTFSAAYIKIKGWFLWCSFDRRPPSLVRHVFIHDRFYREWRSQEYEEIPRESLKEIIQIETFV